MHWTKAFLLFPPQGIKMTTHAGEMLCTEVVSRIRASIPVSTRMIGAEDQAELIQDTIAHAAAMLHSAEAAGKKVTASTVAFFASKLTRSGRRSTSSSKTDVMHPGTQMAGRTRVVSFDEPLGFDEAGDAVTLADVFENGHDDPSTQAARNLDWESFSRKQKHRGRKLLAVVAEGSTLRQGARLLGFSDSGGQLEKKKLATALAEFMGANILAEANRQPMCITSNSSPLEP
jgi:hypothetical protein